MSIVVWLVFCYRASWYVWLTVGRTSGCERMHVLVVSGCVSCVLFRPTPMSCSAVVGVPSERSMYWPRALDAVACYHRRGPLPDSLHNARLVSPKVLTRSSISCCIWTSCHVLQILFAKNRNMWYYDNISCQQILFTSMRYFSILLWYEIARINISLG